MVSPEESVLFQKMTQRATLDRWRYGVACAPNRADKAGVVALDPHHVGVDCPVGFEFQPSIGAGQVWI